MIRDGSGKMKGRRKSARVQRASAYRVLAHVLGHPAPRPDQAFVEPSTGSHQMVSRRNRPMAPAWRAMMERGGGIWPVPESFRIEVHTEPDGRIIAKSERCEVEIPMDAKLEHVRMFLWQAEHNL